MVPLETEVERRHAVFGLLSVILAVLGSLLILISAAMLARATHDVPAHRGSVVFPSRFIYGYLINLVAFIVGILGRQTIWGRLGMGIAVGAVILHLGWFSFAYHP